MPPRRYQWREPQVNREPYEEPVVAAEGTGTTFTRDFLNTLQGFMQQQILPQHKAVPIQTSLRMNEIVE